MEIPQPVQEEVEPILPTLASVSYLGTTMTELDFIDALSDKSLKRKTAAREFLNRVKTAGVSEAVTQFVHQNAHEIGAALAGAGTFVAGQYILNRGGKDGKPSAQQSFTRSIEGNQKLLERQAKKEGRGLSFREELNSALAPAVNKVSDTLAKHPGKGALLAAPAGALIGLRILKAIKG